MRVYGLLQKIKLCGKKGAIATLSPVSGGGGEKAGSIKHCITTH